MDFQTLLTLYHQTLFDLISQSREVLALRDRARTRGASSRRRHSLRRAPRSRGGRHAFLHGRRLARCARRHTKVRTSPRDRARSEPAWDGSLRHARPDRTRRSPQAQSRRSHRLQSQHRHLSGVLSRDREHAHLRRSPEHDRGRAGIRGDDAFKARCLFAPRACHCDRHPRDVVASRYLDPARPRTTSSVCR